MTRVVNLHNDKYDQYIGRAGRGQDGYYGNPFPLRQGEARGATIERYKVWFLARVDQDPEFRSRVLALRDKTLGCFCSPNACHGDVMAEWIDSQPR